MDILKKAPYDQNQDSVLQFNEVYLPTSSAGEKTIKYYSITFSSATIATVSQINITEPGGSAATHSLGGTFATTTAAGRLALVNAINALLETLGYFRGVSIRWADPNVTIITSFSEIVFNYVESTPAGDFTASTPTKTVGF